MHLQKFNSFEDTAQLKSAEAAATGLPQMEYQLPMLSMHDGHRVMPQFGQRTTKFLATGQHRTDVLK